MNARYAGRSVALIAAVAMGAASCSRGQPDATADSASYASTPTIRRSLTVDLRQVDSALALLEDSIGSELGADPTTRVREVRESFNAYRKLQCDRLRAVFKDGTVAPVVELECMVHLADDRRAFLQERYDFMDKVRALKGEKRR